MKFDEFINKQIEVLMPSIQTAEQKAQYEQLKAIAEEVKQARRVLIKMSLISYVDVERSTRAARTAATFTLNS